ncbi:MAG: efflux transporter periplasmic adaptor subunit, partial [Phycisphaerae bacterium]|nr:efflux transporter periplasmic adaptor subunit [Phycisphaerae bacterium]
MRKKYMRYAALVVATLGATVSIAQPPGSGPPPPPQVSTVIVEQKLVPVTFSYSGVTAASKTVEIRARVRGYLHSRDFEEGTLVK